MKLRRCSRWLALALLPACTLTHSLDDLRGGVAEGGASASAGSAGKSGEAATAGAGGSSAGGLGVAGTSSNEAGAGGEASGDGPRLVSTGFSEGSGKQGFLE